MNLGAQTIRIATAPHGRQRALARLLRVDPGVVSRWASGFVKPNGRNRARLRQILGIDLGAWERSEDPQLTESAVRMNFDAISNGRRARSRRAA